MPRTTWKVGELAARTGLTVRTLHHYDQIGLLRPSQRGVGRHRLYADADVARLLEIQCLRRVGFTLKEIRLVLDDPDHDPRALIRMHVRRLREQIRRQQRICRRLETVAARLTAKRRVAAEDLLTLIKEMDMTETIEKYYTPEQLEELEQRAAALGEDHIRQVQEEWRSLIEQVRTEQARGADPTTEPMLTLARRWRELIHEFTGGNKGIEASLRNLYREEGPAVAQQHGMNMDREMMEYVRTAIEALDD